MKTVIGILVLTFASPVWGARQAQSSRTGRARRAQEIRQAWAKERPDFEEAILGSKGAPGQTRLIERQVTRLAAESMKLGRDGTCMYSMLTGKTPDGKTHMIEVQQPPSGDLRVVARTYQRNGSARTTVALSDGSVITYGATGKRIAQRQSKKAQAKKK